MFEVKTYWNIKHNENNCSIVLSILISHNNYFIEQMQLNTTCEYRLSPENVGQHCMKKTWKLEKVVQRWYVTQDKCVYGYIDWHSVKDESIIR